MGIRAYIDATRAAIHACVPRTRPDIGFAVVDGATDTNPRAWILSPMRRTRDTAIGVKGLPRYSGSPCHLIASMMVQVAYRRDEPDDEGLVMALEDVGLLIYALTATPAWWGGPSILSVWQSEAATIEDVEDGNGRPATRVASIPLDVQYLEDGGSVSGVPLPSPYPPLSILVGVGPPPPVGTYPSGTIYYRVRA